MFDKLLDFVVSSVRAEEKRKYDDLRKEATPTKDQVFLERRAGTLIDAARKRALHCREQEQVWTANLESAEKELREKGISLEVFDTNAQNYATNFTYHLASGGISLPSQQFQPRMDQKLMELVKAAKDRMLDYRKRAEQYEKYARAFSVCPDTIIRLSMDDICYFRLES